MVAMQDIKIILSAQQVNVSKLRLALLHLEDDLIDCLSITQDKLYILINNLSVCSQPLRIKFAHETLSPELMLLFVYILPKTKIYSVDFTDVFLDDLTINVLLNKYNIATDYSFFTSKHKIVNAKNEIFTSFLCCNEAREQDSHIKRQTKLLLVLLINKVKYLFDDNQAKQIFKVQQMHKSKILLLNKFEDLMGLEISSINAKTIVVDDASVHESIEEIYDFSEFFAKGVEVIINGNKVLPRIKALLLSANCRRDKIKELQQFLDANIELAHYDHGRLSYLLNSLRCPQKQSTVLYICMPEEIKDVDPGKYDYSMFFTDDSYIEKKLRILIENVWSMNALQQDVLSSRLALRFSRRFFSQYSIQKICLLAYKDKTTELYQQELMDLIGSDAPGVFFERHRI